MPNYIINSNADHKGYNEVHETTCNHLPNYSNRIDLGWHINATSAVSYAKMNGWRHADGCYYCCEEVHHG